MPSRSPRFNPPVQRTRKAVKLDADRRRYSAPWRGWYGTARWQGIREAQLSSQPLCSLCLEAEVVEVATVCDHLEPHRGDEDLFWSGPFQSLCAHHHNSAKQRDEQVGAKRININDINALID